ncbi:chromosome segregation protein SMC [Auraticoccus sp. F435]|uniref:Chromosome partition protein Smc n=1 Tax=Auraticoccus cholistanensis TaxID=2656650 RepID=A0A6A9V1B5_9ACTN|nr:chromosome segregation protein SMC [Auraticoccus cholistanensis]MVA77119.1 chromosome segregation protein SMC [Auraticoccus cholistanensis]
MHLKSLTLRGFKSFASATSLQFEPGITCVVGPNGSGKSNVVDALAWVMGEQGAKSLRGGKMEDVIFAGTSARAPLGRAEVVLTIDNSDGALPIEYTEVTVARTMFRNGGSEYAINGQPARLLDVQELLSDSGIGREMHVIVGQGQLDSILTATPEGRRGFIEEAAGVLKHRKRKEKALRKLEGCEGNLDRLGDLLGEVRRQLKPLGRQAEVARKAAVVQAEVRDARARLLADDLLQATLEMQGDDADEARTRARRAEVEAALASARQEETEQEEALRAAGRALGASQETWYALAGLRERVASTISIARERVRHAAAARPDERTGRDPEQLDAEAEQVGRQEAELREESAAAAAALQRASDHRAEQEQAHTEADRRLAALVRAAADRREGLARLRGQVASLRSRAEAAGEEIGRLTAAREQARQKSAEAARAFTALEATVAGLDAGEVGLDQEHEEAAEALQQLREEQAGLVAAEQAAQQQRAAAAARAEALRSGLERKDAGAALLAAGERLDGVLGSVATLVGVEPGWEQAVSAALGAAADAVVVDGVDAAVQAVEHLRGDDLGRADLLLGGGPDGADVPGPAPAGGRWAVELVSGDTLRPALTRLLAGVVVVADLPAARALVAEHPELTAVTRDGDVLSRWRAAGGTGSGQSLIEVQAAVDEAEEQVVQRQHECDRLRFAMAELAERLAEATHRADAALARLHESDASMAAVAEELGQLSQNARAAEGEAERLGRAITAAEQARDRDLAGLAELEQRLALAEQETDEEEPDPTERDRLAESARLARAAEMEARLALRTVEERVRALAGRAESLRRAAAAERAAREKARQRREQLLREGREAEAVAQAAGWLLERVEESHRAATAQRAAAEQARSDAERELAGVRSRARELAAELQRLVDTAHRDELARAQQRMRIEQLAERAMTELGLGSEVLLAEFGPENPVPVLTRPDGTALTEDDEVPEPVPFVRAEQEKRLRAAERNLAVLGKVNPLALEEFEALQERHAFLAEQLEDLRRTRQDLLDIIAEVDTRVQQVFAEAYADVERAFERVFARLFPGGEGRLVLTEPGQWLTTGVDVEARPAGKKVKRLSLLSGGERSLVAVAFLVSLFMARPSPFYILDEVEAALDDTNLGRLLEIYEELRSTSQLLVITHQKRTMEIADALYGVTMRGDGVSAVISQRLRETEPVA